MKILITGANGMLAKEIRERFQEGNELILTDVAELDITNEEMVMNFVKNEKPECIINCAAFTAVDKAETAGEIVERINADGPGNLAKAAKETNSVLVHVSTDYVFGGDLDLDKDYKEDDPKKPVTAYGITKLHGEEQIEANTDKYYIFRTAWLYGIGGNNFVKTMLKLGEDRDELNVVADQVGSPTYTVDLAKLLVDMVNTEKYGTYHANNEGFCSWAECAKYIFDSSNIKMKVNPIPTKDYPQKATRPLNSKLSKKSLDDAGFDRLPDWMDAVNRYKEELINEDSVEAKVLIKHRKDI